MTTSKDCAFLSWGLNVLSPTSETSFQWDYDEESGEQGEPAGTFTLREGLIASPPSLLFSLFFVTFPRFEMPQEKKKKNLQVQN